MSGCQAAAPASGTAHGDSTGTGPAVSNPDSGHAANGRPYGGASADVVQPQRPTGSCHSRGYGLFSEPDPRCTPGALNPQVTQATIDKTICVRGWTATVRPSERVTEPEKFAAMAAYGTGALPSRVEYEHLVPLSLGGAVNDPRNLWPEPGAGSNPKDALEAALSELVCRGRVRLSFAQRLIAADWVTAYRSYMR
jgi:hypothetical protein